jgi:hypothetical protein
MADAIYKNALAYSGLTPTSYEALLGAITHWQSNLAMARANKIFEIDRESCALCRLYNTTDIPVWERCEGCPVWVDTGRQFCRDTPWHTVFRLREINLYEVDVGKDLVAAVEAELFYLKSLLPSGLLWGLSERLNKFCQKSSESKMTSGD